MSARRRPTSAQVAKVRRDPEVHLCACCGQPNASCGIGDVWYLPAHAPADFWPPESRGDG